MADTLAAHHRRRALLQERQAELRKRNATRPRSLRGAYSDPGYARLRDLMERYLAKRCGELDERTLKKLWTAARASRSEQV